MRKFGLVILVLLLTGVSAGQSTGVAPGYQNLGTVQPGQNRIVNFYVTSSGYDSPYAVTAAPEDPLTSRMLDPLQSPIEVEEYSEEDIDSWMDFTQNEYVVDPTNTTPYVLPNGATINSAGRIRMYLRVPQNAEPGWHGGAIKLNPQTGGGGQGFGATVQTVTQPTFFFRVPGNAERRLEVIDARGIRTGENSARIDIRVANRGTVTTSMTGGNIGVINRETGEKIGNLNIGYNVFRPRRSQVISGDLRTGKIEQGSYRLNGSIDYHSSRAFVDGQTFALSSQVVTQPSQPSDFGGDQQSSPEQQSTPIWLIALFVAVVAVILYSFGFDLYWIIMIAMFLGIAVFILTSPASNWLLVILLTAPFVIFYYA